MGVEQKIKHKKAFSTLNPQPPTRQISVRFSSAINKTNAAWVRRIVVKTLELEKPKKNQVNVYLTNDREIREINRKFLNHDAATDVIAFGRAGRGFLGEEKDYLGDIVVSVETARSVAGELKIPFKEELARYLVHGTLHLLGYDDRAPKNKKRMFSKQEKILEIVHGR